MDYKAQPRQSLIDLALIHCGRAEDALELARINGLALTDDPEGLELAYPTASDERTAQYFAIHSQPATGVDDALELGGINYMGIEIDFVVS